MLKGEELTAGAVDSVRVLGTVLRTCLMQTGPLAGVGFSLMAGSVMRWRHPCKGNFGLLLPWLLMMLKRFVLEKGNDLFNARGWDINSSTDPGWAKCLGFWYRVPARRGCRCWR